MYALQRQMSLHESVQRGICYPCNLREESVKSGSAIGAQGVKQSYPVVV